MLSIFLTVIILLWVTRLAVAAEGYRGRELGRFDSVKDPHHREFRDKTNRIFEMLGRFVTRGSKAYQLTPDENNISGKLRAAGLETVAEQGKFALIKLLCYGSWPIILIAAWSNFRTYYATVSSIFSLALIALIPYLWLKSKTLGRKEDMQRELPLVIDLTNLATSAGWDVSVSLERVIDCLGPEFPNHPLIRELRRARYLASTGYTWHEVLGRLSEKLQDDSVTRATRALVQAMEQGGDRSSQLSGIAQDAQRSYYSNLDKRLAALPVKALIITMVLFMTYFAVLLAPAAVGVLDNLN